MSFQGWRFAATSAPGNLSSIHGWTAEDRGLRLASYDPSVKELERPRLSAEPPDSVEAFAMDLRALWLQAGQPTFGHLAKRTGRSKTSLNNATLSTSPLASADVVRALVDELDPAAVEEWLARRARLLGDIPAPAAAAPIPGTGSDRWSRARVAFVAGASGIAGLGLGLVLGFTLGNRGEPAPVTSSSSPASPPIERVADGMDPAETMCVDDAEVIARRAVKTVGLLELIYSAECRASWGRVTRARTDGLHNRIRVTIANQRDPSQRQSALEPDLNSAYTFLVVADERSDRMCATGKIFTDGKPKSLGPALC